MTKNHETLLWPALQTESRIKVQKATYKKLRKKILDVLGTGHSKLPTQYVFVLPPFWNMRIIIAITDMTK